jgi:hypothetical protein
MIMTSINICNDNWNDANRLFCSWLGSLAKLLGKFGKAVEVALHMPKHTN